VLCDREQLIDVKKNAGDVLRGLIMFNGIRLFRCFVNTTANKPTLGLFVCSFTLVTLAGCASTERHYDQTEDASGKPGWVSYGTQTSKTQIGRIFLGVGVAKTTGEFALQATAANQQAKKEIERMISRFIEVVSRDYIATGAAEPSGYLANEAHQYIDDMTNIVLPSAKIKEHWVDSRNDKIFAIAEIDYPKVVSLLNSAGNVHSGFKVYLKSKGQSVFDRIATQH
jgi:hypothetical protein